MHPVHAKLRIVSKGLSPILLCGAISCGSVDASTVTTKGDATADAGVESAHMVAHPPVEAGLVDAKVDAETSVDGGPAEASRHLGDARADAVDAPALNFGEASITYPALAASVPTIQQQGGPVLKSPHIVTVTWPDETNAAALEAFGDDIGPSPYWTATTSEYGVGPGWSDPASHVRLTEQPVSSWTDTDIQAWLTDHLANNTMYGLPAPDDQTIYALYLSPTTSSNVTLGNMTGCESFAGYHSNLSGSDYVYAVILQCDGNVLTEATDTASHELVEAVTDPHPMDIPGYLGFDAAHLAWDVFQDFNDEVADACEFYYGPNSPDYSQSFNVIEEADAGADGGDGGLVPDAGVVSYEVQRTWSNAAAAAGHNPCVPSVAGPYYNLTPLDQTMITVDLSAIGGGANSQGLGYNIKKGETKTFPVAFRSDGPTSGPWTISARVGSMLVGAAVGSATDVTVSIDKTTGQNGDISYVTVKVNEVNSPMNGELLTISSQLQGSGRNILPILISNE